MFSESTKRHGVIQLNKRIKELAEQAGYYIDPDFDIEFEKFAELILKECAWAADFADKNPGDYVLKHFGVEG